jgi:membrane-associated protease RseP (regulator of RpoE activity)
MKSFLGIVVVPSALLWAFFSIAGSNQDRKPTTKGEVAVVPFEMLASNHMVVEAKLNGKGPYRFIFDLGAPVTLLSNKAADASGSIAKDAPKSFFMGTRGEGKIKRIEMGALVADDLPVIVLDHPALKALSGFLSKPLDGIIGYTFWAHYKLTIDYQAKQMTFSPVDFEVRDLMKDLPNRMAGPKVAKSIVLAPKGLWGFSLGEPEGGLESPGVPVKAVLEGSPAALAGIKVGDILTTLDGRWTTSIHDVYAAAAGVESGKAVAVVVLRDGKEVTVLVTPKEGI